MIYICIFKYIFIDHNETLLPCHPTSTSTSTSTSNSLEKKSNKEISLGLLDWLEEYLFRLENNIYRVMPIGLYIIYIIYVLCICIIYMYYVYVLLAI